MKFLRKNVSMLIRKASKMHDQLLILSFYISILSSSGISTSITNNHHHSNKRSFYSVAQTAI